MPVLGFISADARDQHRRALVKTAAYRVLMVVVTVVVAFAFTSNAEASVGIGLVSNAIKTVTYYGYERLWAHVTWGTAG